MPIFRPTGVWQTIAFFEISPRNNCILPKDCITLSNAYSQASIQRNDEMSKIEKTANQSSFPLDSREKARNFECRRPTIADDFLQTYFLLWRNLYTIYKFSHLIIYKHLLFFSNSTNSFIFRVLMYRFP